MNKASSAELHLHFSILENKSGSFARLSDLYSIPLFGCLNRWYGIYIYPEVSLAHEAVYECLKFYFRHPRIFNPEHGCLQKFLEITVDRTMQNIFEREKYTIPANSLDHILAKYFDDEQDVQLAKLILQDENELSVYVNLLDIGSYRIGQQLFEIGRQRNRIKKILDQVQFSFSNFAVNSKKEYSFHHEVHAINSHNGGDLN